MVLRVPENSYPVVPDTLLSGNQGLKARSCHIHYGSWGRIVESYLDPEGHLVPGLQVAKTMTKIMSLSLH